MTTCVSRTKLTHSWLVTLLGGLSNVVPPQSVSPTVSAAHSSMSTQRCPSESGWSQAPGRYCIPAGHPSDGTSPVDRALRCRASGLRLNQRQCRETKGGWMVCDLEKNSRSPFMCAGNPAVTVPAAQGVSKATSWCATVDGAYRVRPPKAIPALQAASAERAMLHCVARPDASTASCAA